MSRRPTLVCINNANQTITRYVSKPAGGFYTEGFEIVDREQFDSSLTVNTIEQVRVGKMRDQVSEADLADQLA